MGSPETESNEQKVEMSPITKEELDFLREHPPTQDDLTNFEIECERKSDGSKIHQIPGHIGALRMILYIGQTNGWSDETLIDFEQCRKAIRVKLGDPSKYID